MIPLRNNCRAKGNAMFKKSIIIAPTALAIGGAGGAVLHAQTAVPPAYLHFGCAGDQSRSQQVLVAGTLRPAHVLDVVRNFTAFAQADGKTRKVVARYQQFRAVHKAVSKLQEGKTKLQGAERDERGGIIWHTQGSGKSLSMVFLVRKMRTLERLKQFKVVVVTDRTDLEAQLRETAALSGEAVRPTDIDMRTRESATALTQRVLAERTPDIVFAMLQKYQDKDRQAVAARKSR